ncbi:Ohr family peroxiredoxin [Xinfangfangia sp. D13-10-4-6]|uniref:Ohr family peroxiredoxin n=1 Tax=Pseudogemmobacter hezensis TaxID=2737662 RepID=UPI0015525500|nr:Ohr family peroxiredoxin [Pseudogemmobacter hezensis]NPD16808.1 Ohr family peroxiredoxin [Pseudogemmobacter hezensis]
MHHEALAAPQDGLLPRIDRAGDAPAKAPLAFDLALSNSGKTDTNPEQLFALGYAACFDSALSHIIQLRKLDVKSSEISAEIGIGQLPDGGFRLDIDLCVEIAGLDEAAAQGLVEATHRVCPYSSARRNNIDVRLHVSTVQG